MSAPRLYTYFRSGAAQRVRIGLALKGVTYDSVPVHLVRNGGEHLLPAFKAINPQALAARLKSLCEVRVAASGAKRPLAKRVISATGRLSVPMMVERHNFG